MSLYKSVDVAKFKFIDSIDKYYKSVHENVDIYNIYGKCTYTISFYGEAVFEYHLSMLNDEFVEDTCLYKQGLGTKFMYNPARVWYVFDR